MYCRRTRAYGPGTGIDIKCEWNQYEDPVPVYLGYFIENYFRRAHYLIP